ncbi:MAG: ABC transporter permease [Inconstantimicrobium porci]|uniref:ABC transporter permease n=2 Tax=Inconstantimicrobium porci TaxID=2652291 RepID=UPI002A91FE23|nr:ABC transporter permease [Inconstantimicrobium porci]MDY5913354.1 ABC transporter permease [Inconstantimicrobium porci]
MTGFFTMFKYNLKLIMRNRAAVILVFLIPLLSTLIFKIPFSDESNDDEIKLNVMIFDNSKTDMSKMLVSSLKENKCFYVDVYDQGKITMDDAKKISEEKVNRSITNTFIYIPDSFYDDVISGKDKKLIKFLTRGGDDRFDMLKESVNISLGSYSMFAKLSRGNRSEFDKLIKKLSDNKTKCKVKSIPGGNAVLSSIQEEQNENFGYFLAIMTITLMLSSNFIASIFIEEKDNRVLKRIGLTKCSMVCYASVKMIIALTVLGIQSIMIAVGIKMFGGSDVGLSSVDIIVIIFFMGIVFSMLSIVFASIFGELYTVNYIVFFIATISTLLSGLYFPIDKTPMWMQKVALIMPQRWAILSAQGIMTGTYNVLYIFMIIMISYTVLLMCLSLFSLKNKIIES